MWWLWVIVTLTGPVKGEDSEAVRITYKPLERKMVLNLSLTFLIEAERAEWAFLMLQYKHLGNGHNQILMNTTNSKRIFHGKIRMDQTHWNLYVQSGVKTKRTLTDKLSNPASQREPQSTC